MKIFSNRLLTTIFALALAAICAGPVGLLQTRGASYVGVYSGTFDFKPMFVDLISLGTLTGNEWLAGISFGSEPACCSGKLYLTNLSYNWQ